MARRWGKKKPPVGFDYIQPTLEALSAELREVNSTPTGGKNKLESNWPIIQINNQRTRYIYDMFAVHKKISRELYMYCVKEKMVDAALVAKWKKAGYEKLCSVFVIDRRNFPFGTTSICRVPKKSLGNKMIFEANTGCRGCASGSGTSNIFGNKYGQRLARVQVLREAKLEALYGGGSTSSGSSSSSSSSSSTTDSEPNESSMLQSQKAAAEAPGPWASMDSSDEEDDDDDEEESANDTNSGHKRRAESEEDNESSKRRKN